MLMNIMLGSAVQVEVHVFQYEQCEEALNSFNQLYTTGDSLPKNNIFIQYDQKQIQDFLTNCFVTAQKEGSVKVYFG